MNFIKQQISSFKSFYSSHNNQITAKDRQHSLEVKNRLSTILFLLKSTIINGFWTVDEQLYEILPLLLNILTNNKTDILHQKENENLDSEQLEEEFEKFKSEVSNPTPSIEMIIECKALTCMLIEIIFDFRKNNLVTDIVKFYRVLDL